MGSIDCELALSLHHDGYGRMKVVWNYFGCLRLRKLLILLLLYERNDEKATTPGASYRHKRGD